MQPLVTVIMPVYNREDLLMESLDSLLEQTYDKWECIMVDDGSTDATEEVAKTYLREDQRFQFFKRPSSRKKGAASCRNIGLEQATGDFIQFLDSDDLLSPDKLKLQVQALQQNRDTLAFCNWSLFENKNDATNLENDRFFKSDRYEPLELLEELGRHNTYLPVHSFLIPAKLVNKAGSWDESLSNNDDADFMCRVLVNATAVIYVKNAMAFYRKPEKNTGVSAYSSIAKVDSVIRSWQNIERILKEHYGPNNSLYVENSKQRLYKNIKWENPGLLNPHREFFRKQITQERRAKNPILILLKSIRKKLKISSFRTNGL